MTLFDSPAEKSNKSRAMAFTIGALALFVIVLSYFAFRYYPERRAAEHFFDALVAGDTDTAYRLWKPGPSYSMKDFMADWGPQGYYGPVKSYKILKVNAPKKPMPLPCVWRLVRFRPCPMPAMRKKAARPG
jgi:hypothetical protein